MTALAVATESPAETLDRIRGRLAIDTQAGDIRGMVACRAAAYSVRDYLDGAERLGADEVMRRAERAIGVAIRRGQADGTIRTVGRPGAGDAGRPSASAFMPRSELHRPGNERTVGVYQITDGVTDEEFETALAEARAAGNMSRVGVYRMIPRDVSEDDAPPPAVPGPRDKSFAAVRRRLEILKDMASDGFTSEQIGERLGRDPQTIRETARRERVVISGDLVTGRLRRHTHDSDQIVQAAVSALEGLAMAIGHVDFGDLDQTLLSGWVTSLARSTRAINRMKRNLAREATTQ